MLAFKVKVLQICQSCQRADIFDWVAFKVKLGQKEAEELTLNHIGLAYTNQGEYELALGEQRGLGVEQRINNSLPSEVNTRLSQPYYWAPFILIGNGL